MMQIVIPCWALKSADDTCSPLAKERLALLASDIQDIIALSENAVLTAPLLLTLFGLVYPFALKKSFTTSSTPYQRYCSDWLLLLQIS